MSQRLFVGVGLDQATRTSLQRALQAAEAAAPSGLRWLAVQSWHFTLQFLGDVQEDAVPALSAACGRAASAQLGFALELSGAGAFGSARAARVLWIGVSRGSEQLTALRAAVVAQTEPLGFAPEARAFTPHLTVARLKRPANVEPLLARLDLPALSMQVSELTLFRSHLSQKGSHYEAIVRHLLGRTQ